MSPEVASFSDRCGCTITRSPHEDISAASGSSVSDGDAPIASVPSSPASEPSRRSVAAAGVCSSHAPFVSENRLLSPRRSRFTPPPPRPERSRALPREPAPTRPARGHHPRTRSRRSRADASPPAPLFRRRATACSSPGRAPRRRLALAADALGRPPARGLAHRRAAFLLCAAATSSEDL